MRDPSGRVAARLREVGEGAVVTSAIVAAEMRYGAAKKGSPALSARVEALLSEVEALPFDAGDARAYGAVRAELEGRGAVIGGNDMLIASQCLARGLVAVTANAREFGRVDGLEVEDWRAGPRGAAP